MPIAAIDGEEFHYDIAGSGPPVVLVTGLAGTAGWWDANLAAFTERFTVITYDHRGTGRSVRTEGEYSIEILAEDLRRLLVHLGIARASIVGHSTGGAIGQVLAALHPEMVDRLVLYGSWSTLCPQMRVCMEIRRDLLAAYGPAAYHKASPVFLFPPRYVCEEWPTVEAGIERGIAASTTPTILEARAQAVMAFDGTDYLPRIVAPTLILVANDDVLTPVPASEELAAGIVGSELYILPYGAHGASMCAAEEFNRLVIEFVSGA